MSEQKPAGTDDADAEKTEDAKTPDDAEKPDDVKKPDDAEPKAEKKKNETEKKKNKKEADETDEKNKKDADETEKKKKDADETEKKKNKKEADETDEKNKKEADETNEKKEADETSEQNKKDADETDEQNKKATGDIKWNPELGKACWQKEEGVIISSTPFVDKDDEVKVSFGGLLWSVPHLVPSDLDPSMPANPPQQKVKAKAGSSPSQWRSTSTRSSAASIAHKAPRTP